MKVVLGQKIGMTQTWSPEGALVGVTLIKVNPNILIEKTDKTITLGTRAERRVLRPQQYLKKLIKSDKGVWLKTIKADADLPEEFSVAQFEIGDKVKVSGVTKGKGTAGVVKRHGFAGWPASHGHSHQRRPGSIGNQQPQRVPKGKKMAGHMGGTQATVRGGKIVSVDIKGEILAVSGSIPGNNGSQVIVRSIN